MPDNEDSGRGDYRREYTPYASPDADYRNSLERYPLCLLGKQNRAYFETYKINISEEVGGDDNLRTLEQSWQLIASSKFGLPRGTDQDVYMAINELLRQRNGMPADNTLHFTFYEMLQCLGWSTSGELRRRLEESLQRMASTTIVARNVFYSPTRGSRVERTFKPFSLQVGIYEESQHKLTERHRLVFDPFFAEMWSQTYRDGMDLSMYWRIKGHVARRLYRMVEDQARGSGKSRTRSWSVDLFELADLMPLANYRYASQIKRLVVSAGEELVDEGFLSTYSFYTPKGESKSTVVARFEVSRAFDNRRIGKEVERDPLRAVAIEKMVEVTAGLKGSVSRTQASRMVEQYGAAYCLHYAELFLYQKPKGGGLLVSGIENGWDWERPATYSTDGSSAASRDSESSSTAPRSPSDTPVGNDECGESGSGYESFSEGGGVQSNETPGSDNMQGVEQGSSGHSEPDHSEGDRPERDAAADRVPKERALADKFYQQILSEISDDDSVLPVSDWFEGTYARSLDGGVLTLVVFNDVARDYIAKRFKERMESYLSEVLGAHGYTGEVELRLVVGEEG